MNHQLFIFKKKKEEEEIPLHAVLLLPGPLTAIILQCYQQLHSRHLPAEEVVAFAGKIRAYFL